MKRIFRKLKRSNKILRYIYYFINIVYIISLFFFVKSLLSLTGIETALRIIFILFFILHIILYAFINLLNLLQKKYKGLIITSIVSAIFILIFLFSSYYINVVYNNLNNMTESKELLYTTYLITLKDNDFDNKSQIGLIAEKVEKEDHNLAQKLYSKEKLANSIEEYDDYLLMLNDLYNHKIDAIFVPGNYITLFKNEENYENIETDTKVLFEYSEKMTNEDLYLSSDKDFSEPLTFLLLGVDSEKSGLNAQAAFNGDTLMIITFNPKTLNTLMVSIPRDTYVPIACRNNVYSKINSAAAYGTSCVVNTINNLLDIDIDYYVKINFKGVVELVDAIGGIEVDVEKPYFNSYNGINYNGKVCEQNSDRQFGTNTICIDPGWQLLNGEQALAYARNRHLYIGGDLDRIKHQQQVVEAIAAKALQFNSIADFQKILSAISNNLATNMDTDTILSGYQVIKNMIGNIISGEDLLNINKAYLETYSQGVYIPSQGSATSAQGYYTDSLNDIKEAIKITLGLKEEEVIKTFHFSVNEPYEIYSPGKGKRSGESISLLPDFVGKTVTEAQDYCDNMGISLNIEYVDPDNEHYNSAINIGLIGSQNIHASVLAESVSNLTVYVVNSKNDSNTINDEDENITSENTNQNNSNDNEEEIDEIIENMLF